MSKKVKCIIGISATIMVILVAVFSVMFITIGNEEMKDGKYYIKNSAEYPDAYIIVEDGKMKFQNIDLNALYREKQLSDYNKMIESGLEFDISDEQLEQISDLNENFVTNAYEIKYDGVNEDSKSGIFKYTYFLFYNHSPFGLVIEYDALNKTIQVNNPIQNLVFEK